ncbi:ATP-binding protein [Flindersiella endophytica]
MNLLPGRTVRVRLTLLYGALFLLSGTALLAVTYLLFVSATGFSFTGANGESISFTGSPPPDDPLSSELQEQAAAQQAAGKRALLAQSGVALAGMSVVSIGIGWVVSGRMLRKLSTITSAVREISATNLHARLGFAGPDDELKELGDTFDGLLARLEAAFRAQQRFVANASHELRTPLARQRALSQVALADPDASEATLRAAHERVLMSGAEQERLIEALLTLARGQAGVTAYERFGLAELAEEVMLSREGAIAGRRLAVDARLRPAAVEGDRRLVAQLLSNLVDNAVRHNVDSGWLEIHTGLQEGRPYVSVANGGPRIPEPEVPRLFEPFRRFGTDRVGGPRGHGLGLSIVQAIATSHDATVVARAQPRGGLVVELSFPVPASHRTPETPAAAASPPSSAPASPPPPPGTSEPAPRNTLPARRSPRTT